MTSQLTLIDTDTASWKIPAATREIGRRGLAEARAVLHSIPRRHEEDAHTDTGHTDTGHTDAGHVSHPAAA